MNIAHTAAHPLPISNGWGEHTDRAGSRTVIVYCGRCRAEFTPDAEWVKQLAATRRGKADHARARGWITPGQHLDALQAITADETRMLEADGAA